MQVFEELAKPGALYQQFYKWGLDLQHKGVRTLAEGDPTAEQLMTNLNSVLETSSAGVEKHEVALCVALHHMGTSNALLASNCSCHKTYVTSQIQHITHILVHVQGTS